MARFDVYRLPGRDGLLVLDLQADLLGDLATCVVAPLAPKSAGRREALPRLNPVLRVAAKEYVLRPQEIAVVPRGALRNPVANVEAEHRSDITAALDFLFQGF